MSGGWDYLAKLKAEDQAARRRDRYEGRDVSDQEAAVMVQELQDLEDGPTISEWEVNFLDSVGDLDRFSETQRRKIDQIHHDRIRAGGSK